MLNGGSFRFRFENALASMLRIFLAVKSVIGLNCVRWGDTLLPYSKIQAFWILRHDISRVGSSPFSVSLDLDNHVAYFPMVKVASGGFRNYPLPPCYY